MADVFEDRPDLDGPRARLWALIASTPHLDWLLLSKRWGIADVASMIPGPLPSNVWLGATAENQEYADKRCAALLAVPAVVHFLSVEPQLGSVTPPSGINWVISGCESGPKSRVTPTDLYRGTRDACTAIGAAFFLKQARLGTDGISVGKRSWIKGGDIVEQPYLDKVQHIAFPLPSNTTAL